MRNQQQTRTETSQRQDTNASSQAATSAAQPRITADIKSQPQVQLTGEEKQALSQAGARLLLHVDKARQALAYKDKEEALNQINKGLTLARIIDRTAPACQVNATIKAGDLVYQDQSMEKMLDIPIYSELGQVSILAPIEAAKRDSAQKSQLTGIPVVQDVELQHTAVTLDARMSKRQLKAAKTMLDNDQPEPADQALAAIQTSGVSFTYAETDLPLIRARENLTLAKDLLTQQRPEAARTALHEAAHALSSYGRQVDETRASQVKSLRQQITELSQNLENNQAGAAERISHLWDQVTELAG